jgi:hypothetical protein
MHLHNDYANFMQNLLQNLCKIGALCEGQSVIKGLISSPLIFMVHKHYLQDVGLAHQDRGENSTCWFACLVAHSSIYAEWVILQ